MKFHLLNTKSPLETPKEKIAWCTRDELKDFFQPDYYESVIDMI
jgi:hypothetical protein